MRRLEILSITLLGVGIALLAAPIAEASGGSLNLIQDSAPAAPDPSSTGNPEAAVDSSAEHPSGHGPDWWKAQMGDKQARVAAAQAALDSATDIDARTRMLLEDSVEAAERDLKALRDRARRSDVPQEWLR